MRAGVRPSTRRATYASILLALLCISSAQAQPVRADGPGTALLDPRTLTPAPGPRNVGLDYLLELPERIQEPGFAATALLAQMEQQGAVPWGTLDGSEAQLDRAKQYVYSDYHLACDLDLDGFQDVLTNDHERDRFNGISTSRLTAVSGVNGSVLWEQDNEYHFKLWYYEQPGLPLPSPLDNVHGFPDLNGDGTCDFITYRLNPDPTNWREINSGAGAGIVTGTLALRSGADGKEIWIRPIASPWALVNIAFSDVLVVKDFPSGFLAFETAEGPRFLVQTTDVYRFRYPSGEETQIAEHIFLHDARTGDVLWRRDLDFEVNGQYMNATWFAGVAGLDAGAEPDVVLHQLLVVRGAALGPNGRTPAARAARGMNVLALSGADGSDLWRTQVWLDDNRPAIDGEEDRETLRWTHAQILGDVTGDGVPEPVALVLTQGGGSVTTLSGRSRTHFFPLNGTNGHRIWTGDVRYQGWGFATDLNTPGRGAGLIGIGTVDLPTFAHATTARFPLKTINLAVLKVEDGSPVWSYDGRFAQDNYLVYQLAVQQFLASLAPYDWNRDGIRDLVTPALYREPEGLNQTLMGTTRHSYEIRSGTDGALLHRVSSWGPKGLVVDCGPESADLTIVSGYASHLEASHVNVSRGEVVWRQILYLDATPPSSVAGTDLVLLGASCGRSMAGETLVGLNMALLSLRRNTAHPAFLTWNPEVVPIVGMVAPSGLIRWQRPLPQVKHIVGDAFELLPEGVTSHPNLGIELAISLAPALPGALLGAAILTIRRRWKTRPKEDEYDLEL